MKKPTTNNRIDHLWDLKNDIIIEQKAIMFDLLYNPEVKMSPEQADLMARYTELVGNEVDLVFEVCEEHMRQGIKVRRK